MGIKLKPITNGFGAYASGINLSGKLSKKATDEIEAGMDMYAVLVWRESAARRGGIIARAGSLARKRSTCNVNNWTTEQ